MRSQLYKLSSKLRKLSGKLPVVLTASGAIMMSGCSTTVSEPTPPIEFSAYCPHPRTFADWSDFTSRTKLVKGESAFQTAKRFRLAEQRKNLAGQRLWSGFKQCRAKKATPVARPDPKSGMPDSVADILSGGF